MRQYQYRVAFQWLRHYVDNNNQLLLSGHCQRRLAQSLAAVAATSNKNNNNNNSSNNNNQQPILLTQAAQSQSTSTSRCYSKFSTHLNTERAMELICNLDEEERTNLRTAMGKLEADKEKKLYTSQLAVGSWRTRFGRLSNKPALGQVDPSGTFCAMPEEWLKKRLVETAQPPTAGQLSQIFMVNAVPFIAFGFLDNFIMISAGEYIEFYLGQCIVLSTMAAAGLGNTISDVMGISMATYVENACQILGLQPPKLTPAQFELKASKRSSSWGRILGITAGCLLGMCPLWFMSDKDEANKKAVEPKVTIGLVDVSKDR